MNAEMLFSVGSDFVRPPNKTTAMTCFSTLAARRGHIGAAREMIGEEGSPSLQSPLLVPISSDQISQSKGGGELRSGGCSSSSSSRKGEIVGEVKRQLWLAGPLVGVNLMQMCLQVISVMFVGHLGELALSGASMATSFAGVTDLDVSADTATTTQVDGVPQCTPISNPRLDRADKISSLVVGVINAE
ncbi:hypothetical protein ACLOJK_032893 [Asimina triloba]